MHHKRDVMRYSTYLSGELIILLNSSFLHISFGYYGLRIFRNFIKPIAKFRKSNLLYLNCEISQYYCVFFAIIARNEIMLLRNLNI